MTETFESDGDVWFCDQNGCRIFKLQTPFSFQTTKEHFERMQKEEYHRRCEQKKKWVQTQNWTIEKLMGIGLTYFHSNNLEEYYQIYGEIMSDLEQIVVDEFPIFDNEIPLLVDD